MLGLYVKFTVNMIKSQCQNLPWRSSKALSLCFLNCIVNLVTERISLSVILNSPGNQMFEFTYF